MVHIKTIEKHKNVELHSSNKGGLCMVKRRVERIILDFI